MITRQKRARKILKQSQKWRFIPKHYNLENIKNKRGKNPYTFYLPNLWNQFCGQSIEELLEDKLLDIVISSTNTFTGNTIVQETMTYQQFVQYQGPLTLYLAQVELEVECPKLLNDYGKSFLWCSKGFTDSGWHYDSYANYLGVVQGIKIVYLRKKCNDWSLFESVWLDQYNHMRKGEKMSSRFIILRKDQMLYIPQGMFHRVISYDTTIGVNVWMESIQDEKVKGNHYQFRYILNDLIQSDLKDVLLKESRKIIKKINTQYYLSDIKGGFQQLQNFSSLYRSKTQKPLHQLIGIYICLLALLDSSYMVQFLLKLSEMISINNLTYLPQTYQAIIAIKLDEFSDSCTQVDQREQFFQILQQNVDFIDSLKTSQTQMKQKIALMIVSGHLGM